MSIAKLLIILFVASILESVGVAFLSGGLREIQDDTQVTQITPAGIARVIKKGATNAKIILGISLEAVFFGFLLYMLSQNDVSLVWPLTSLGFIITTVAAGVFLKEHISWQRWAGVAFISLGAVIISYSKAMEDQKKAAVPVTVSAPLSPK